MTSLFDYTQSSMEAASVHHVGNKANEEELILSNTPLDVSEEQLHMLLMRFFLQSFTNQEFFNFSYSSEEEHSNAVYTFAQRIFNEEAPFHDVSADLAKHLYEITDLPQIKDGDLFVVHFSGVRKENQIFEAIGLFKSETKNSFLKLKDTGDDFELDHDQGINVDKLDKGCLILNVNKDEGYHVCIVDKSNRGAEAQYWRENFLNIKPCADEYHHTQEFMNITKNYVSQQMPNEFEVDRADQIDLLNRSVEYFKENEEFDKEEFEENVLQDPEVINSFRNYDTQYRQDNEIEMEDSFEISPHAVKKEAKAFKSVLKLDKNFHVYIHGDRNKIERGVESDGRKFYKIYYDQEM